MSTQTASSGCAEAVESFRSYLEGELAPADAAAMLEHLQACAGCKAEFEKRKQIIHMLGQAYGPKRISDEFDVSANRRMLAHRRTPTAPKGVSLPVANPSEKLLDSEIVEETEPSVSSMDEGWLARLGAAPWWIVSAALHGLAILLIGLVTMAIHRPDAVADLVMVTQLNRKLEMRNTEDEKQKPSARDILEQPLDVRATDPNSSVASNIVVPPDILAKAELSDHFETINLDRPDTQSAFGNPDARMFHSASGNDEPEGGGGLGGTSLSEELIGVGGSNSPGSGGGWGGGIGTGTGIGKGSGHGSFGHRNGGGRRLLVARHGGSKATESAVDAALEWLSRHQEKDGFWDTDKYLDNKAMRYGGDQASISPKYDPGLTGFSALAFLGAGHSLRIGKYKSNVQSAIKWLIAQQGADGDFTSKVQPCHASVKFYCHCIATLACAEALAMNGGKDWMDETAYAQGKDNGLKRAVELGVELILKWQRENSSGGWTYYGPTVTDVTVSGWAVMALKSAKIAGITVPMESFQKASEAVKNCTILDKTKGDYGEAHIGYLQKGSHQFNSKGYAITAAGMMIQVFVGGDREATGVDACAAFITKPDALPQWIFKPETPATDHQNLYYWYYGTLGCFQAGGDAWKLWNEKMKGALLPNQRRGGAKDGTPQDVDGSWDPDDCWGAWAGRVYSTALGCLCLEVYYRYLPLYK